MGSVALIAISCGPRLRRVSGGASLRRATAGANLALILALALVRAL